jgi:hypothetical protein
MAGIPGEKPFWNQTGDTILAWARLTSCARYNFFLLLLTAFIKQWPSPLPPSSL